MPGSRANGEGSGRRGALGAGWAELVAALMFPEAPGVTRRTSSRGAGFPNRHPSCCQAPRRCGGVRLMRRAVRGPHVGPPAAL